MKLATRIVTKILITTKTFKLVNIIYGNFKINLIK